MDSYGLTWTPMRSQQVHGYKSHLDSHGLKWPLVDSYGFFTKVKFNFI